MHFLSIVATVLTSTAIAARGSPLPPSTLHQRATVKLHILTGAPEPCTPAQVASIKAGIKDAQAMATNANQVLFVKNAAKSTALRSLFGQAVNPSAIGKRFQAVINMGTPDEITSLDSVQNSEEDVTITCVPASNPKSQKAVANTVNIGTKSATFAPNGATVNVIRFTPSGLQNTESFTAAAARLRTNPKDTTLAFDITNPKIPLPCFAFTMIHEVQHSVPLLGGLQHFVDEKTPDGEKAYGITQIQTVLTDAQKIINPQNYAYFAIFAKSNPEFFSPTCVNAQLGGEEPKPRSLNLRRSLFSGLTKSKAAPAPVVSAVPAKGAPLTAAAATCAIQSTIPGVDTIPFLDFDGTVDL
ncbi:hypothetical protein C8R44DRAFT_846755 [Mycena epipterygia]|nr:hypothetical protein C8R44DRAFT_846755 [Mycena epipterygia]